MFSLGTPCMFSTHEYFLWFLGEGTPTIKGKKGTLKRRREVKALLEHHAQKQPGEDDDDDCDLFDSTPFRAKKKKMV